MSTPAATGRPMPDLDAPLPARPDQRVGLAVVGLGRFAVNQILPRIAQTEHVRLAALVSGNPDKAGEIAAAYGIGAAHVYGYESFERIARDETVDAVYLVLPNALHRVWAERAFAAGKHVLCEKPMAATVEDGEAMIAAAEAAGKQLMMAYRVHFEPLNQTARARIEAGEIGTPLLVVADHGRPLDPSDTRDVWRARRDLAGGGSLYDIGIYSINGVCYLLGEAPVEVTAQWLPGSGRDEVEVEEGVAFQLRFPSGVVASCTSSYRVAGVKRIHVEGSAGTLTLDPASDYTANVLTVDTRDGSRESTGATADQFTAMLDAFADAVRENRSPPTPAEDGLRDLRIMQAVYRAADTGHTVRLGDD